MNGRFILLCFIVFHFVIPELCTAQHFNWVGLLGGISPCNALDVTSDGSGNVISVGDFSGAADFDPFDKTYYLLSDRTSDDKSNSSDAFISKLDKSGNFIWARQLAGSGNAFAKAVAADAKGNIYLTGSFTGVVDLDPDSTGTLNVTSAGTTSDVFIVKLNAAGDLVWGKTIGGKLADEGIDLSIDEWGYVYVTGTFNDTMDADPGPGTTNLVAVKSSDIFIMKLDGQGNLVWAKSVGGTGLDKSASIAAHRSGCYITGLFAGAVDFDPGPGVTMLTTLLGDIFVLKLDTSGGFAWARQSKNPAGFIGVSLVLNSFLDIDPWGNVYATGSYVGAKDFSTPKSSAPGAISSALPAYAVFYVKWTMDGELAWAKQIITKPYTSYHPIAVDKTGCIYTTGVFSDTLIDLDPDDGVFEMTRRYAFNTQAYLSKLDSSGKFIWGGNLEVMDVDGHLRSCAIAADEYKNVYTAGNFDGEVDFDPDRSTSYLLTIPFSSTFIHKMSCGPVDTVVVSTCSAYTFNGETYSSSGVYTHTYSNTEGCDSNIVLNLTIVRIDTAITQSGDTLVANMPAASYQWLDCDNGYAPVGGAASRQFIPEKSGSYAVVVSRNGCKDTSGCYAVHQLHIQDAGLKNELLLYPNPLSEQVATLTSRQKLSKVDIHVINAIGQTVISKTNLYGDYFDIDFSGHAGGLYIVEVCHEGKKAQFKLIKQ